MNARDEVATLNETFEKAVANQDLDTVMDLYADDAKLLPPGAPIQNGREEIRTFFQAMLDGGVQSLELRSSNVEGEGDLVVDVGTYRLAIAVPDADSIVDDGKYIVVLKRQSDGALRLAYDTFNSDAPAPG